MFVSFLGWNRQVEAPHGRLLFPALGAAAVVLSLGLAQLARRSRGILRSGVVMGAVLAGLAALALAAPFAWIIPAYAQPDVFPPEALERRYPGIERRHMIYGDPRKGTDGGEAQLLGLRLGASSVTAGEWLDVTLCWQAMRPLSRDYTLFLHILGRENLVVGARTTVPGLGRFPTTLWPAGQAFCDRVPVYIEPWALGPELYAIEVGLYERKSEDRLEAVDTPSGQPVIPPIAGRVRVAPLQPNQVTPEHPVDARWQNATLLGFDAPQQVRPGQEFSLRLYWQVRGSPAENYTVFAHLVDAQGRAVAQADAEPLGGAYPTSAWVAGDVIADPHLLAIPAGLPAGAYRLNIGLYLAPDGPRLPLLSAGQGTLPGNDTLTLATLQVVSP